MGCVKTDTFANNALQAGLNFGLVVIICIQSVGCISGAHINPAVTLAALIYGKISVIMSFVYVVAQIIGGFLGYGLLKLVLPVAIIKSPEADHGFCITLPHSEIGALKAFGIEFIISTVLIFVCCGVWDSRNSAFGDSVAIRFGLAVSGLAITAV